LNKKEIEREFLLKIFLENLKGNKINFRNSSMFLTPFRQKNKEIISMLIRKGFIKRTRDGIKLTCKGRRTIKVVLCGGTFDILHPGHLLTLRKAKSLGDILVVVVSRDKIAEKIRGRKPYNDENKRLELVSALKIVDYALLGGENEKIYDMILKIRPDVVVLGYDQVHKEDEIKDFAAKNGLDVKVIRISEKLEGVKSSTLLKDHNITNQI
jgi:cytidyltransferase-like protein